ncbi:hypothetical protein MHU86_14329 [Fragilaria crotonensis]|nr:hypothetical protein MHU86_14329 [Fragilaria crotonensis]
MPAPVIVTAQNDQSEKDTTFLESKSTKQALSLLRVLDASQPKVAYRKQFAGSLLLSVQYRMHPSIAAFSSAVFYNSQLSTPSYMRHVRKFPTLTSSIGPLSDNTVGRSDDIPNVRFVHVGGRCHERLGSPSSKLSKRGGGPMALYLADATTSYSNEAEAARIVEVLKDVLKNNKGASVGVVSPYTGQVELIKELLSKDKEYEKLAANLEAPVEVKSVDGYQGRERDIILFSTVRSNRSGSIGFLRDWRRMNVALTRAKNGLIVVGDLDCLEEGDKHWAAFGKWCRGVQCVVE